MDRAAAELELPNVRTLHARAEDAGKDPEHREVYDLVVSRAVASLPVLLELGTPLVKVGGFFAAYKSGEVDAEIQSAAAAMEAMHVGFRTSVPFAAAF